MSLWSLNGETAHHIDRNKSNNNIENLVVLSAAEHARLHALENVHHRERDENGRFS